MSLAYLNYWFFDERHHEFQMNKFVKGLILSLVLAAPVAIAAPAIQAEAAPISAKTTRIAARPTALKSSKVHHKTAHRHQRRHHVRKTTSK